MINVEESMYCIELLKGRVSGCFLSRFFFFLNKKNIKGQTIRAPKLFLEIKLSIWHFYFFQKNLYSLNYISLIYSFKGRERASGFNEEKVFFVPIKRPSHRTEQSENIPKS